MRVVWSSWSSCLGARLCCLVSTFDILHSSFIAQARGHSSIFYLPSAILYPSPLPQGLADEGFDGVAGLAGGVGVDGGEGGAEPGEAADEVGDHEDLTIGGVS